MVLFQLVKQVGRDACHRCGKPIDCPEDLSIDHRLPWLDVSATLFWDLDNVTFSHRRCNSAARRSRLGTKLGPSSLRKHGPEERVGAAATPASRRLLNSTATEQNGPDFRASARPARFKVTGVRGANPAVARGGVAEWLNAVLLKSTEPDEGSVRSNRTASLAAVLSCGCQASTRSVSTAMSSWCLPVTTDWRIAFAGCSALRTSSRIIASYTAASPAT